MLLIQTTRETLLGTLQAVTGIVERRHTLPILSNVLVEGSSNGFAFVATDLEIQVRSESASASAFEPFSTTVAAKKLQDILRTLPEETTVSMEQSDSKMIIKAGKSRFTLQSLPAEDFPRFAAEDSPLASLQISQKTFRKMLGRVQFAMAQQDIRYYLNGMLLVLGPGEVRVVATDGHRLSYDRLDAGSGVQGEGEVIVPRKTVLELMRLLADSDEPLVVEIGKSQVRFRFANIVMHSKVVDGKFPDYGKVIPTGYKNRFTVARSEMLKALQRAAILSNEKFRGVRLVLTLDSMKIVSSNSEQEEAEEELEIDYKGDALDIGFNVNYLVDVLTSIEGDRVECAFGDSNSSALITLPDDANFKYVVMPMRI